MRAQDRGERVGAADATVPPAPAPPALRLAEPPAGEEEVGRPGASDREAAELARRIEAEVGTASEALRTGPASAPERLREHRAQVEDEARRRDEAARWHEEERELPGAATIGFELALGALRLVRSMATAPLRIGLAFLRRGDEGASRS